MSIVERARASQSPAADGSVQPATLPFDKTEVTGFRYRVRQVLSGLRNRKVIREARAAELRQEMLNSERLRAHFEDNPDDLRVLRHDGPLLPSRVRPELASLPSYLLPGSVRAAAEAAAASSAKKQADAESASAGGAAAASKRGGKRGGGGKGSEDPLKAFSKHAARMGVGSDNKATFKVGPGAYTVGGGGGGAGTSKSGRSMWKMRHKKGKFSHRNSNKPSRPF
jgi:ATP-dependent RNA helicase DDX56/DBP9